MADQHSNFAYSTVATAPSPAPSGTTLTVATGDGALFPLAPFNVTVWPGPGGVQPTSVNAEIVRVTSKGAGDNWTISRTQESTSARSIVVGDQISATLTARTLADAESANTLLITQSSHGFVVGDVLRYTGSAYAKAQADSTTNAEVVGIVSVATDSSHFAMTSGGRVTGLSGLTAGSVYFLDPSTAGALTATEPTATGQISKPLLVADATTSGYFFNYRGLVVGGGITVADVGLLVAVELFA